MEETRIGGPAAEFPPTAWSLVAACDRGDPEAFRRGMDRLIREYWRPIYATIRRFCGRNVDDAKDLTQGFFLYLLEHAAVEKFDAERARFRTYLKAVLKHFLSDHDRREQALKRGKGVAVVSIGDLPGWEPEGPDDVEAYFDREWVHAIFEAALAKLQAEGDAALLIEHDVRGTAASYAELAARHGMKEGDVRNRLRAQRLRLREIVGALVRETTAHAAACRDEVEHVLGER